MKTTGKFLGIVLLSLIFVVPAISGNYEIDKKKSTVKWTGKKVTGKHYGTIDLHSGSIQTEGKKITSGSFKMNMESIVCEDLTNESTNKKLVGHLKSDDFFSVEKFPVSKMELKEIEHKGGSDYTFTGHLTIKGVTHPVTFDAKTEVENGQLVSKGTIEVDRTRYDIRYGSGKFFDNLGDNMIYDTFTLDFDVVANEVSGTAMSENN